MNLAEKLPQESLIRAWVDAWPAAEPPKAYLVFAALSLFGGAFGRGVYMDQDAHILFPMLNLLLIGPSGIGKSTSIHIARHLINALPPELAPQFIAGKATPEKLHDDLIMEPHAIIFASELANFFSKTQYMADMIPYVTQLLDYEERVERRTRSSDLLVVKDPSVTIVGGSTVEWLQDQLPDSAASGGFLARFLIVKEDHKFQRVADAKSFMSTAAWEKVMAKRELVKERFIHTVAGHMGEITYDSPLARDTYSIWYQTQTPLTGALSPFSARAGEFVLRLAMLTALSCDRHSITSEDINCAISLYEYSSRRLQEVVIPFSPAGRMLTKVFDAVGHSTTPLAQILRALRNSAPAQEVERMLDSLERSNEIIFADGGFRRVTRRD